jgi:hypothetical protein
MISIGQTVFPQRGLVFSSTNDVKLKIGENEIGCGSLCVAEW